MYFQKSPLENRPEASYFMRRHNALSYDVIGRRARNCSKKYNVTCVILKKIMKWLHERENHVINLTMNAILCDALYLSHLFSVEVI